VVQPKQLRNIETRELDGVSALFLVDAQRFDASRFNAFIVSKPGLAHHTLERPQVAVRRPMIYFSA